eukprot:COSAG06_NODE_13317_length_1269_cov_1.032479_2_plen_144_part_00
MDERAMEVEILEPWNVVWQGVCASCPRFAVAYYRSRMCIEYCGGVETNGLVLNVFTGSRLDDRDFVTERDNPDYGDLEKSYKSARFCNFFGAVAACSLQSCSVFGMGFEPSIVACTDDTIQQAVVCSQNGLTWHDLDLAGHRE